MGGKLIGKRKRERKRERESKSSSRRRREGRVKEGEEKLQIRKSKRE